ncbi:MAG: LCP family protein [Anaerolineae bacterium]|nr:LCP family protein [Anaerolineae bacterium]
MQPLPVQVRPGYNYTHLQKENRGGWNCWLTGCCGCFGSLGIMLVLGLLVIIGGLLAYQANPPEPVTILILGGDARPGTNQEQIARTDSIMLLTVNPRQESVSLLSIPRGVFITSPQYGTLMANTIIRNAELNEPGRGIPAMRYSMEYTLGTEIDHYARLNFQAFVEMVDALGGIEIDVPKRIVDDTYPTHAGGIMRIEFQPGLQQMDGETALIYARTRHGDDDYQRATRQQQVVNAVLEKLVNPANAHRLPAVLRVIEDNVESDMSIDDFWALAPGILLYGNNPDAIERLVIEREHLYYTDGNPHLNLDTIEVWLDQHVR